MVPPGFFQLGSFICPVVSGPDRWWTLKLTQTSLDVRNWYLLHAQATAQSIGKLNGHTGDS